jgi:alkanesulfonate monooxygenase SsuD/methylene tetrahydromethanopterin reductase-like flavin-dependent oxidoreductase (luciferase family)
MFPGRFLLGVGTGQAMSEQRFLGEWPEWKQRAERLREGVSLMRKLWESEEYFDWKGRYFSVDKVYLYTRPVSKIEIYVSARGKYAARIAGAIGDHVMTTVGDPSKIKQEIIPEFKRAMRASGRDPSRALLIAYVEFGIGDVDELVRMLKNGSAAQGLVDAARNEMDPREIQKMGSQASSEALVKYHHLVRKAEELIPTAQGLLDAGCNYIIFSDESRHPDENMKKIKDEVLPHLK